MIIKNLGSFFEPKKAEEIAARLNEDPEEEWVFQPVHDPKGTGFSYIAIYDENDNFVGKL